MLNEILFILLAFAGSVISSTFGIGSAIFILPIATLFMPAKAAIALITIYFIFNNISKIVVFYRYIQWRTILPLWYGSVPGVILGAFLMVYAPSQLLTRLLGIIVLVKNLPS